MTIKVGDTLPESDPDRIHRNRRQWLLGRPQCLQSGRSGQGQEHRAVRAAGRAFTPTCSAQHVPSYLRIFDVLKAKGVDEIWCISVNDAFVMGAWRA